MSMFTARITIGGAFPPFNLLQVLKGAPAGAQGTPAGITIDRVFPNLENGAARITITNEDAANVIFEGQDSGVSLASHGFRILAGQTEIIEDGAGWNNKRINRWLQSATAAGAPVAGVVSVTIEQK